MEAVMTFIKRYRTPLMIVVLVATVIAVWYYLAHHPEIFVTLKGLQWTLAIGVIIGYIVATLGFGIVLLYSVRLLGKRLTLTETFLLNGYSSVVNFFGPGQGGSGVRAVYLKVKHAIRIRDFVMASLLYYAIYSVISVIMLFVGAGAYLFALVAALVTVMISVLVISRYRRGNVLPGIKHPEAIVGIVLGTVVQLAALSAIYYMELHAVEPHIAVAQAVSYTGSANMSLFVALTPGAIGIREALLLVTQSFHHVDTTTIVAAGVIDRAVYIVFLGMLALVIGLVHGRQRLAVA